MLSLMWVICRERIKDSCDELRKILPKQLLSGRRQDMATVSRYHRKTSVEIRALHLSENSLTRLSYLRKEGININKETIKDLFC